MKMQFHKGFGPIVAFVVGNAPFNNSPTQQQLSMLYAVDGLGSVSDLRVV